MLNNQKQGIQISFNKRWSASRFIIAIVYAFVAIYQPPMQVSIIYILTFVSWSYLLLFAHINYSEYTGVFLAFLLIFVWIMLMVIMNGAKISNISHLFWMMACSIPVAASFSAYVDKSNKSFDYLFHVLLCAAAIQAVLAYMCLFSEEIHQSFFDRMQQVNLYTDDHIDKWGYRIYGYGMSLMYAIPVVQGVISAWAVLYGIEKGKLLYAIIGSLILISAVISAKIGAIVFAVTLVLGLVIGHGIYKKHFFRLLLIALVCAVILVYAYNYSQKSDNKLSEWLGILFNSESLDEYYGSYFTNQEKWRLPEGLSILVGTGATRPGYDVDMGIVRDAWIGGLLYSIFIVATVFYLGKRIKNNLLFPELWREMISISLIVSFFVAYIKGEAFSYSPFMAFFFIVALFSDKNGRIRQTAVAINE